MDFSKFYFFLVQIYIYQSLKPVNSANYLTFYIYF